MRATSDGENPWRTWARKSCHRTQDCQHDAGAPEFDVCGHYAICIQPDWPARSSEELDIQSWPCDRSMTSHSFFADAPDVVRFCSRLRLPLSAIFPRPGRDKSFPLCERRIVSITSDAPRHFLSRLS